MTVSCPTAGHYAGDGDVWAPWVQYYDERWLVKNAGLDENAVRPPKGHGCPVRHPARLREAGLLIR